MPIGQGVGKQLTRPCFARETDFWSVVDGNPRTHLWTLLLTKAIKLKKETFWAWLIWKSPDSADRYWQAKTAAAAAVAKEKDGAWEELGEALDKDSQLTQLKRFWDTIWHLGRGKWGTVRAVLSKNGETLTSTGDTVER